MYGYVQFEPDSVFRHEVYNVAVLFYLVEGEWYLDTASVRAIPWRD
jgi:hypothetical protein